MEKTVLVTGASAGIGKATAIYLAQNGYTVYGAARRVEKMDDLKSFGIKTIALDVTDDASMVATVQKIIAESGRIDVLVNNAGFGAYGAIEDVPMKDAKYQLDVNVFGAMRMIQLVLPGMRKNRYGKIVNISSIGGKGAAPLGGWYHASKFALEGISDSLRNEVKQFGIDVIVIEPGGIKSEWGGIALDNMLKMSGDTPYKDLASGLRKAFIRTSEMNPEPILIAKLIKKGIEAENPRTRYAGGYLAKPALLAAKLLPDRMMDKVIMAQFK